jgi:transcriptional regulator with XRE-family HTH domain
VERSAALGRTVRKFRRSKGVTLQQVADASNLSKSFISQIESGNANPSIASLKRIADVLEIPLAALFDGDGAAGGRSDVTPAPDPPVDEVKIVRRDRRKRLAWPGREGTTYLLTPDLRRKLEVIMSVMQPGEQAGDEMYSHAGEEFGLVLEGRYEVTVAGERYVLEAGDSIYYPSHLPHRTRVLGDTPVRTLWVITPPSF